MDISENSALFVYADNEPKSVPARDLGGCRDNHKKPAQRVFYGLSGGRAGQECSWQAPEADGPETRVCGILQTWRFKIEIFRYRGTGSLRGDHDEKQEYLCHRRQKA